MTTTVRIAARSARGSYREERQAAWAQSGLAVTRYVGGKGWAVTHVASGYALFRGFNTLAAAKAAAQQALALGYWTVSRTALQKNRALVSSVKAMRNELKLES